MNEISIAISYKEQGGDIFQDLNRELELECILNVQSKPGTAAMGIWDSVVNIIINLELKDYVMIVLGGTSWDLIKKGSRKFFLKPIIEAFKKLEEVNQNFDYLSLNLKFKDTEIVIYGLDKLLTSRLGITMPLIVKHYSKLLKNNVAPHTVFVPIRFRTEENEYVDYGSGDDFDLNEYKLFWGVFYDAFGYERDVYNVSQSKLMNVEFKKY